MTNITVVDPQLTPASKTGILDSLKKVGSAIGDLGTSVADGTSGLIGGTKAGQTAAKIGVKAFDGVKVAAKEISDAGGKIGSKLSGEETHTRIQELVTQQTRYNDILATRLAESLDRIEKLEQQVEKLSRGR